MDYVTKPFNRARIAGPRANPPGTEACPRTVCGRMNEEKNEFMGIAAHDLRNPLCAIKGYCGDDHGRRASPAAAAKISRTDWREPRFATPPRAWRRWCKIFWMPTGSSAGKCS